jgi:citrate lyase subunit beta / citryl-CoA lyase
MNNTLLSARSLLFLPSDRLERLDKALASGAHAVVIDLEDAVAADAKDAARHALLQHWPALGPVQRMRIAVRINAVATPWHERDLELVRRLAQEDLGGVMLAKTESAPQLGQVLRVAPTATLLPLVETAEGLSALEAIARSPSVARLVFGHLDFQIDLGMQCAADERELDAARLQFVVVSRRAGLAAPIDGVTVDLQDAHRLQQDCARTRRFGFGAKLCIHPRQVAAVNDAFAPTEEQLAWARRVTEAARERGAGAFQFEGAMVDAPVLARARHVLSRTS